MQAEKKWLIKSSETIRGPFEFDHVVESIFNGDTHLLDEIKGPYERWRPIKDHSLFAAAIEKLKATTYQVREHTLTANVDLGTKTHELTRSQTISITNQETNTITPVTPDKDTNTSGAVSNAYQPMSQDQQAPFSVAANDNTKRRFPTVFIFSFLLFVIGGASYLVYEFKQTRLVEQKISAYDQLTDVAIQALKEGEYQKALKNFTRAYNISPQDPNLLVEMSPLSVQFDGQFDQVQFALENMLLTNSREKILVKLARNIIGLTYSYRQQYAKALASYDESIKFDDHYLPAQLNKSFILIKLKKYEEAVSLMRFMVSESPEEAIAHYFYIRSLLELGVANKDVKYLKEMLSVADQFFQKFSDFKQEVLFLIAVAHLNLKSDPVEIKKHVDDFLRVDFELTNLHVHDTAIDFQSFNWLDYNKYCQPLISVLGDYDGSMLKAFCLLKVNRTLEAKKIFESLLSQQNNNGLLHGLYTSTLLKLNDLSQAKNALGFISQVDLKQPMVEALLRGCLLAEDLSCGEAIFRGRHAKHISLLYSHWGNSAVNFTKDRRKAKSSVVLGLEISPNFAPLLKIKRRF